MNREHTKLLGLEGLKGIGCCLVAFFWHYRHFGDNIAFPLNRIFFLLYNNGGLAVELFFILSGFTMSLSYIDRIKNDKITLANYLFYRLKKVWPLFFITLLVTTAEQLIYIGMTGHTFVVENFDISHFLLNVVLLQSGWLENTYSFNSPAWFLSTLFLCYLVFYFVCKLQTRKQFSIISAVLAIVGFLSIIFQWQIPFLHYSFGGRGICCFFLGVLIYVVNSYSLKKFKLFVLEMMLIAFYAFAWFVSNRFGLQFGKVQILCILIVFPLLILGSIRLKPVERCLSFFPLQYLGRISMDIYLWHFPIQLMIVIIGLLANIAWPYESVLFWLFYIVLVVVIASCSYSIRSMKKRI